MNQARRRFRVRPRPEPRPGGSEISSWNLFARLDPSIAYALFKEAQLTLSESGSTTRGSGWTVSQSSLSPHVEFLPLEIVFASGDRIYVSYNGGDVHPNDDPDLAIVPRRSDVQPNIADLPVIELPQSVLRDSHFQQQGEHVIVRPLSWVQDAISLQLEALSVSDWELLESDAKFLEDGGLLQQVSVVYPNQILPLRVKGRDVAHVKVLPDKDNTISCWRLMANTEVIVAPPSSTQNDHFDTVLLRVYPTWLDYSNPMRKLADELGVHLLRTGQIGVGIVHPTTLKLLQGCKHDVPHAQNDEANVDADNEVETLAYVELISPRSNHAANYQVVRLLPSALGVPLNHICFHPLVALALAAQPLLTKVNVRLLNSAEVALGQIGLVQSIMNNNLKIGMKLARICRTRNAKLCRSPSNAIAEQALQSFSTALSREPDLLWLADSSRFDLPSNTPGDTPLSAGSLLRVSTIGNSSATLLFRFTFDLQDDNKPNLFSKESKAAFVILGDLVGLLNQNLHVQEVMKVFESPELIHRQDQTNVLPLSREFDTLNFLPPTMVCPSLDKACASVDAPGHTMITGPIGSGRTHMALLKAAKARLEAGLSTHHLDCKNLKLSPEVRMRELLNEFTTLFQDAVASAPSMIILDNLDEVAPNLRTDVSDDGPAQNYQQVNPASIDQAKLVTDHLRQLVTEACTIPEVISIVITCCDQQQLVPSIVTMLPWQVVPTVLKLSSEDRRTIFSSMLQNVLSSLGTFDMLQFPFMQSFDNQTNGFRPCDLETLALRIGRLLHAKDEAIHSDRFDEALSEALCDFVPVARQSIVEDDAATSLSWSEVGGLFRVKESLTETILQPVKYRKIYEKSPIKLPRGILLFGPPGCGKSILVPALAKECGFRLVTCRGPELLDKYIGASEAKVRELFARAKAASPCILFLDEFDALAPRRGSDHTGVTDRVVNQLLTFLDGVEDTLDDLIYIIAATSRPDKVDPALLRPGRLEKHFFVGMSESEVEWLDLLTRMASKRNLDEDATQALSSGDFKRLVSGHVYSSQVMQLSGADMKAVLDTAHISAVHDCLKQGGSEVCIRLEHLQIAFQKTRPSLSTADGKILLDIYRPFLQNGENERKAFGPSHPAERQLMTTLI